VSSRADRGRALRALGIGVSVVSLAAVAWWAAHQDAPRLPSSAREVAQLCAALGFYLLTACVWRGERWLLLLHFNGATAAKRGDAYALSAVGFMGNNVLPARAGDAMRVVGMTPRASSNYRTVIGTLVAERVLDVLTLLAVFAIVSFGLLHGVKMPDAGRFELLGAIAVGVLLAAGIGGYTLHRRGRLAHALDFLKPMLAATANLRGRHGVEALGLTLLIWGTEILVWFLTGHAAGLGQSVLETCYLLSLASIFVMVPAGPGYAGTLDAALIFGVKAIGGSGADALSYLLLLRFVLLVPITLAGLGALVARYGGMRFMKARPA
jgi:uncharacterized membrane protein YbhN (UPF0104 family)